MSDSKPSADAPTLQLTAVTITQHTEQQHVEPKQRKFEQHGLEEDGSNTIVDAATDPELAPNAPESRSTGVKLKLPTFLVNFLLPEVPPGDAAARLCNMPKATCQLLLYFLMFAYNMGMGFWTFAQFRALVTRPGYFGHRFDLMWLASMVIFLVYHVIGPLPRALRDVSTCPTPHGWYYQYKLSENDCLHFGRARGLKLSMIPMATFIQVGTFYLSFFMKVVERGVKVPSAILAIVPVVLNLGYTLGTVFIYGQPDAEQLARKGLSQMQIQQRLEKVSKARELFHLALYTPEMDDSPARREARQKLARRSLLAILTICATFGAFLVLVYVVSSQFGEDYRDVRQQVEGGFSDSRNFGGGSFGSNDNFGSSVVGSNPDLVNSNFGDGGFTIPAGGF